MGWYASVYAQTALDWLHWIHEQLGIYLDIALAAMIVLPALVALFMNIGGGSSSSDDDTSPDPE